MVRNLSPRAHVARCRLPVISCLQSHSISLRSCLSKSSINDGFTFGLIADVQWADTHDGYNYGNTVKRCYRGALVTLQSAVDWWRKLPTPPVFIAQLGNLIDGINKTLGNTDCAISTALSHLSRAPCPSVNLVGNHELSNFSRSKLATKSWLRHGDAEFYSFSPAPGWQTIVLDPYQIALMGHALDDPRRKEAVKILAKENPKVFSDSKKGDWSQGMEDAGYQRRFVPCNGGFGDAQLVWFRKELAKSAEDGMKVIIMSHVTIHPQACGGSSMAWDYQEALDVIHSEEANGCVVAVLSGHDPKGGYYCDDKGVHHCTFVSPLTKGEEGFAFGLVHIRPEYMEIRGPKIDDLLPFKNRRPIAGWLGEGDSISGPCEFIRLFLKPATEQTTKGDIISNVDLSMSESYDMMQF